jgi:hypothetical protein
MAPLNSFAQQLLALYDPEDRNTAIVFDSTFSAYPLQLSSGNIRYQNGADGVGLRTGYAGS